MDDSNAEQDNEHITLEVEGARYTTTECDLTSYVDSTLGIMFGRRSDMLHAQDDGSYKINQPCVRFNWILDLHGDHNAQRFRKRMLDLNEEERRQLLRDVDYFGLEDEVGYWIVDWVLGYLRNRDAPSFRNRIAGLNEEDRRQLRSDIIFLGLHDEMELWLEALAFQPGPDMRRARSSFASVPHGRSLYVFGGDHTNLSSTEIMNVDTMEVEEGPPMDSEREGCAAVQIDESRILVIGGMDEDGCLNTTEVHNTKTKEVVPGPTLLTARAFHAAVAIDEHRVLIAGGESCDVNDVGELALSTTEVLHLPTMTFSPGPKMVSPKVFCHAVKLDSDRVLVVGSDDTYCSGTTEILDITSGDITSWSFVPVPTMSLGCMYVSSVVPLHDSAHFLFVGRFDSPVRAINTTYVLDVNTLSLEPGPLMRMDRMGCSAAALDDHRIIVLGGGGSNGKLSSSEVITINNNISAE